MNPCSIEGCDKPARTRGWCATHYARWRRTGTLGPAQGRKPRTPIPKQACNFDGCESPRYSLGYCIKHYQRWRKYGVEGLADKSKTCNVEGCERPHSSQRGMCNMHYLRMQRHGDPGANFSKFGKGFTNPDGYRVITVSPYKTMLEHRYVMEQMLCRPLEPYENVHHLNGRRDDNRPENLELWSTWQPSGQRVEDLVAFVVEHYRALVIDAL